MQIHKTFVVFISSSQRATKNASFYIKGLLKHFTTQQLTKIFLETSPLKWNFKGDGIFSTSDKKVA